MNEIRKIIEELVKNSKLSLVEDLWLTADCNLIGKEFATDVSLADFDIIMSSKATLNNKVEPIKLIICFDDGLQNFARVWEHYRINNYKLKDYINNGLLLSMEQSIALLLKNTNYRIVDLDNVETYEEYFNNDTKNINLCLNTFTKEVLSDQLKQELEEQVKNLIYNYFKK